MPKKDTSMEASLKQKLQAYSIPKDAIKLIQNTGIVFVVGASGAGKDTIIRELLVSGKYYHIVSHTTRIPRLNKGVLEKDGVDYHFVDFEQIGHMLDNQEFIEAKVFSGNVYGTSVSEIQKAHDQGLIAITDIEVQGVAEYRAISDKIIPIFILPPDFDTWQERLLKRYEGGVDLEDLGKRMETAKSELADALQKDYFEFVINSDLKRTVKVVDEIAHANFSDEKNRQAKVIAKDLLSKLSI